MNKKDLPINYMPSAKDAEYVLFYLKHDKKFMAHESSLNKLINELCKTNDCLDDVMIKCSALNDIYNTNIFDVYAVAEHIMDVKNLDVRLQQGDYSLVDEIACVTINGKKHRFYSFATKYCSLHQPTKYAIYDSYLEKVLMAMKRRERYTNETRDKLKTYENYMSVILSFQYYFGLTQYSLYDLDKYLWQLGKWHFSPYVSLTKYYKGEDKTPFDHEDYRDHFWWGEKMFNQHLEDRSEEWSKMWTEEGKKWLQNANDKIKNLASKYSDEQFGVITYISGLFGKHCPYDDQSWIIKY